MNLRFISWNIHSRNQVSEHIELLRRTAGDLVALQEVTETGYRTLVASGLFAWSAFSLEFRQPEAGEGRGRQLGCAVFGQEPFRCKRAFLLENAPLPERALIVEIEGPAGPLTVCSFHTPPGASWGQIKPKALVALAQWLAQQQTRVLVGMDANAPKIDHPHIEQNEWWWDKEPLMLGAQAIHPLKDAFRVWLAAHPEEAEQLYVRYPHGPLAVSHVRGRGASSTPCRYDFIYITPEFSVADICYRYDEAIQAGSDHALVLSDLTYASDHRIS